MLTGVVFKSNSDGTIGINCQRKYEESKPICEEQTDDNGTIEINCKKIIETDLICEEQSAQMI